MGINLNSAGQLQSMRVELVNFLDEKRVKALQHGKFKRAYNLSLWMIWTRRQATPQEIAMAYIEYWNTQYNAGRLRRVKPQSRYQNL